MAVGITHNKHRSRLGRGGRLAALAAMLGALAGCDLARLPGASEGQRPMALQTAAPPAPRGAEPAPPGGESLREFYASIEGDLTASGRMRREIAPADAPYSTEDLMRDFERVALHDEYVDLGGRFVQAESPALLRRWEGPVRVAGLRDATVKFAEIWTRSRDPEARAAYVDLLGDLETSFATHRTQLLLDDRSDLDIEIEVLRERLKQDGLVARQ